MKIRYSFILLSLLPFFLSNCEEVMEDFSVQNSDPQLVIEAQCSSQNDSVYVYISKTADYMNPLTYPTVSDAQVLLSFADTSISIPEIQPGTYAAHYDFPLNTNYIIEVQVDGITYTAESFMSSVVPIDSTQTSIFPYSPYMARYPGELFYEITMFFKEPANSKNFYRIKTWKNDTLLNNSSDIIIFNDKLINGENYELLLRGYTFEVDDTVKFEFMSIDEASYEYYNTLIEAMSSTGNFSVPDNPKSNFTPTVLGYFMAYSSDITTIIIKADSISIPEYIP